MIDEDEKHVVLRVTATPQQVLLGPWPLFTGGSQLLESTFRTVMSSRSPSLIVTANVDHVNKLARSSALRDAYDLAQLRLIDGAPIAWLARMVARRPVTRHTGADLLPQVSSWIQSTGEHMVIVGGSSAVGESAVSRLTSKYPGARITHLPVPKIGLFEHTPSLNEALRLLEPKVVFVCLGAPKQELWFTRNRHELPAATFIGAGAAIDFAGGHKKRAPLIAQNLGLEWLWRLALEPRRLAFRYLVEGPKFLGVAVRSIGRRLR